MAIIQEEKHPVYEVPDNAPAVPAFVERAVWHLSKKHTVDHDTDYLRRANEFCDLVTTSESHWVAAFCEYVLRKVCADHQRATFNRFFEIPSLHSENHKQAGYDLSVGPFDTNNRYRLMHKTAIEWCDRNWSWDAESKNDKDHLAAILGINHPPSVRHKTFFILHVFRCIHDWRRMGMSFEDKQRENDTYSIPDIPSILRTLVIPLDSLKNGYDQGKWVRIMRKAPEYTNGPTQEYLSSIEDLECVKCDIGGKSLTPITLNRLCEMMSEEWKDDGMWSGSSLK